MKPAQWIFLTLALSCLHPIVPSAAALLTGMAFALIFGNPFANETKVWTPKLLQFSVMGMGAAMDLSVVGKVGVQGIGYTIIGIVATLALGFFLGKALKIGRDTVLLVSSGTAICGGSAIAAIAAVTGARAAEVSVALVVVFLLNALALFIFPPIGHALSMSQPDFGMWSALAIHDTSSVVGAGLQYGTEALQIATTVKLARALWIIPLALAVGLSRSKGTAALAKVKKPWFILGFLLAAALVTFVPSLQPAGQWVAVVARRFLVVTLFLIGSGLTRDALKEVGLRPFLLGFLLWICVASATLGALRIGWIVPV